METIESIVRTATDCYIEKQITKGCADLRLVETELMRDITVRCSIVNHDRSALGYPRIRTPSRLDSQQIAQILCAAMYVHTVLAPDGADPQLMLWDGRIYKPDPRTIRLEALKLNGQLSKNELNRIEQRMTLLMEPVVPVSEGRCTAYRNGILVSEPGLTVTSEHGETRLEPGTLYPFTPEIVLLSVRDEDWAPSTDEHRKED